MWPVVHTIAGNLYFKPESPGLMVCPQDESPTEPLDAYPEELDVAIALDRLLDIAEMPVERVLHQWAGLRTFAADRRPVVGFDPRTTGFFWLAGQGGFGVQTSPRLGALGAAAINDGAHVPDDFNVLRLIASAGHQ
jgi:D-arginine dehydrogenase